MRRGDVFAVSWQGGGGWGDPLLREPASVLRDLTRGAISPRTVREIYGVVVMDGAVALAETDTLRGHMRQQRVGGFRELPKIDGAVDVMPIGPAMRLMRAQGALHVVTAAGHVLCSGHTRWREGAVSAPVAAAALPRHVLHAELAMTAWYCPASGTQLGFDIHRADEAPEHDIELHLERWAG
jgi:N-methylhydantoinase B